MSNPSEFNEIVQKLTQNQNNQTATDYNTPPALNTKIELSDNGKEIFNRRYRRRDADGNYIESIEETYMRVATHVAKAEESSEKQIYYGNVFYNFLTRQEFIPNAPTWTGAGTPLGQLAACFVLPIDDDMGTSPSGIFSTLRNAALIQQTGGGNGFSFSRIRPEGDTVKSSMGVASGPVGFLEVYDAAFEEIAQGGIRRGANMAVLRVDHPDVRKFITCKSKEGKVKNFNISVAITDVFMDAVKNDGEYDLINPRNGEVWETVKAREIFDLIVENAWLNGEPGLLFIDEANRYNPVPNQYQLEATNPCGEQWLGPYENCCLGHINLLVHIHDGVVDWESLAKTTKIATRFLDDVVTVNGYVPAVPELKAAAHKNRRIGLGYTGLADVMYVLGIRYGSEEGVEFAAQISEFIRFHSMKTSIELAQERGSFPGIVGSIYDPNNLKWEVPTPIRTYTRSWHRPKMNWNELREELLRHGIRNSTQMTVAPTGSTSTVLGVEGYGCEPVFALAYERNVYQAAGQNEKLTLQYVSPLFEAKLAELDIDEDQKKLIIETIIETGTCQKIDDLPKNLRDTFVVSADITPEEHILMQASIQAFIDNSISKTCNFPSDATRDDVRKVYYQAWEQKCKGLTIYRAGSRQEIVLETKETKDKKSVVTEDPDSKNMYVVRPRDNSLYGVTQKIVTPLGNMYITVNKTNEGDYHEAFVNLGLAGSDVRADTDAIGRLISLIFRLGTANSNQRMHAIIEALEGISSGMVGGFNGERVLSVPDAIAKGLKRVDNPDAYHTKQEQLVMVMPKIVDTDTHRAEKVHKELCPMCGNYSVLMVEGCKKCTTQLGGCGEYSVC